MPVPDPFADYDLNYYPYITGYCSVDDVVAQITSGNWNPSAPDAFPTMDQTIRHIKRATARVDMTLAAEGYTVPLQAIPGFVNTVTSLAGIQPQGWMLLDEITAILAAGWVELTRHGSGEANADKEGHRLVMLADDMLSQIKSGHLNLTVFGINGPFEPIADISRAASLGGLTDTAGNDTRLFRSDNTPARRFGTAGNWDF